MFDFKLFEAVHWDFWERTVVPLDGKLNTVVGPNGSGKTTFLDGMRTLLGIKCSDERDYKRYARRNKRPTVWLRAVVSNERSSQGYPFRPYISKEVTLVCRIRNKGGDWPREYAILEGDVPIEQVEEKAGKNWMGIREYETCLERAGLTRAIKHVLTLEQGATDKLSGLVPRELLKLIFDAQGDQEALDNYQHARDRQMTIKTELDELQKDLEGLELKIGINQQKIDSYNRWRQLLNKQERLKLEDIPRLEILELQEQIRGSRHNRRGILRERKRLRDQKRERVGHLEGLQEQVATSEKNHQEKETAAKNALVAHTEAKNRRDRTKEILAENARLERLTQKQKDGFDPVAIEKEKDGYQVDLAEVKNRIQQLKSSIHVAQGELNAVKATWRKELPTAAQRMREALNAEGISHQFLSEVLDIELDDWQPAIEGLIGQDALTILVDCKEHQTRGWKFGEQFRFRSIVTGDLVDACAPRRGTLLEAVSFRSPVPMWLINRLDQTRRVETIEEGRALPESVNWVTRGGYYREKRGGRYIAVDQRSSFMFGDAAVQAEIERLEEQIRTEEKELKSHEKTRDGLITKIDDCVKLVIGWDANKDLVARMTEFVQAETDLPVQSEDLRQAGVRLNETEADKQQALAQFRTFSSAADKTEQSIGFLDQQIAEKDGLAQAEYDKIKRWIETSRGKRVKFGLGQLTQAILQTVREEVGTLGQAQAQYQNNQELLDGQEWETDPQVIAIGQKYRLDHEAKSQTIKTRRENHVMALALVDEAREKYIYVLQATMRRYAANLRILADMAGVEVKVTHPQLANDDHSLAQAGLDVEFRFDAKDSDETSGGQKVIKSLILLVALMMDDDEPGGFIFVDEPYAHLDVVNINLVSNFLRASKAQFVLTTPNTHNINVFESGDITLVTRTRKAPAPWAPPISMVRKDNPA